jgi:hypothetical protein
MQAMIAEETCASHALSSAKIMADCSEPPLNPGRMEARGRGEIVFAAQNVKARHKET